MSAAEQRSGGFWLVWGLALALGVLHHDWWLWGDETLVFGFLPTGLLYHALFSLGCGVLWALAVRFAWPEHIEEWADEVEAAPSHGAAP